MSLETSNSYELALVDELHFKVALTGWSGSPSIGYTRIGVPKLSVVKFHTSLQLPKPDALYPLVFQ